MEGGLIERVFSFRGFFFTPSYNGGEMRSFFLSFFSLKVFIFFVFPSFSSFF